MSKRVIAVWCLVLGGLLATACGEADASADASDKAEKPKPPAAEATTTTTTAPPPPYSFDGSVPPPPLVNTGTDYEAIFRSLSSYATWLLAHNPDPALLGDAYVVGTPVYDRFKSDIEIAESNDLRLVDVDDHVEVTVVDELPQLVSMRVREELDKVQAIDRAGTVVDESDYSEPLDWLATITADSQGRWRIASVELAEGAASRL
jgi:hypothetical protein